MNQEQEQTIFEAFGQADNSITRLYGGTGLGLVICKRLAFAMKGDMGFTSKEHVGSTFWFTFQCEINPLPTVASIENHGLKDKKVLYYEESEHSRLATQEIMARWNMIITPVNNLTHLYQKLAEGAHYDYALVGHGMAASALTELRKTVAKIKPIIPKIHLAINSHSPSLQEALISNGATSCISKPITAHRLLRAFLPDYLLLLDVNNAALPEKMPIKVLAVDDNPENLKLIHALLDELVCEIVLAKNGKEALELCNNEMFSMIFMDIQMPIMDGITALEKISKTTINSNTPIVAVTAHALSGERERLKQKGFTTYLAKPIDDKMLSHAIYEHCDLAQPYPSRIDVQQNPVETPIFIDSDHSNIHILPTLKSLSTYQTKVIDWPLALQRTGNKISLAKEMLTGLIESLPETQKAIAEAITSQNIDKIKSLIHKLNGACCYTGVPNLCEISLLIETELKSGASLEDLEPEFLEFFEHIEQVLITAPKALEVI